MKNPYYDSNYTNCWHGDEMFHGLEADIDDVLTAIAHENYTTVDDMDGKDWLEALGDSNVKDEIVKWVAQHYWFDELKEPLEMLRHAIKQHLDA